MVSGALATLFGFETDVEEADAFFELRGDRMVLAGPAGMPMRIDSGGVVAAGEIDLADGEVVGQGGHPAMGAGSARVADVWAIHLAKIGGKYEIT